MNDNGAIAVAALAEDALRLLLDLNPVAATLVGIREHDDRLPDYTEAGEQAARDRLAALAARGAALDPADLSRQDGLTRSVVHQGARARYDEISARTTEYTITDSMLHRRSGCSRCCRWSACPTRPRPTPTWPGCGGSRRCSKRWRAGTGPGSPAAGRRYGGWSKRR